VEVILDEVVIIKISLGIFDFDELERLGPF
jgi:hypothetical protein